MADFIFLGTSNAISDENHENTHMVVVGEQRMVLIDCPSNPLIRLKKTGVDIDFLSDIILTHFHPDHVSGVPLFLMDLWLMGRTQPLNVFGSPYTLARIEKLMDFYGWSTWPDFYPVKFNRLSQKQLSLVLESDEFRILSSPVKHFIPTIGLRIEFKSSKKILAYSSDTRPCPQLFRLARNADVLVHESTGDIPGHSSPEQAGQMASNAEVKSLYLVHYPTEGFSTQAPLIAARRYFSGPIVMAEDYMKINFD